MYHINPNNEIKPCSAKYIFNCPFHENPIKSPHYEDYEDAKGFVESIAKFEYNISLKASQFRDSLAKDSSIENMVDNGRQLESFIAEKLDFYTTKPANEWSKVEKAEYINYVQALYNGLTRGSTKVPLEFLSGTKAKEIQEIAKILPNGVSHIGWNYPLHVQYSKGKIGSTSGTYRVDYIDIGVEPTRLRIKPIERLEKELEKGDFFVEEYDMEGFISVQLHKYQGKDEPVESYYLNKKGSKRPSPSKGITYKKIKLKDSEKIFTYSDKNKMLNHNDWDVYQINKKTKMLTSIIQYAPYASESTKLHELTHFYQDKLGATEDGRNFTMLEKELYDECATDEYNYDVGLKAKRGFSVDYAGLNTKQELITTSTESLFLATYPEYFDNSKPNAEKIRHWTYSYWLLASQYGDKVEEKRKARKELLEK